MVEGETDGRSPRICTYMTVSIKIYRVLNASLQPAATACWLPPKPRGSVKRTIVFNYNCTQINPTTSKFDLRAL